jgi:peptide chain release factor 2
MTLARMLNGKDDEKNAIVSINPGAGGTEAQDWAEMLFRMYLRWAERKNYKTTVVDFQPGEEAGVKGVTFIASGPYAYGYLKGEAGIHRACPRSMPVIVDTPPLPRSLFLRN